MTLLAAIVMLALFIVSYLIFKSWFAPAVIYCASWTLALFSIAALEPLLYGISGSAMVCYSVAAALFVVGTLFGQGFRRPFAPAPVPGSWRVKQVRVVVDVMLFILFLATPLLIHQLITANGIGGFVSMLRDTRVDSVEASGEIGSFGLLKNLPVLAQFVALIAVYISDGSLASRARISVAAALWLLVALPSGSKLIALQLPFVIAAGFAISRRKIPWRIAFLSAAGFGVVFLAGLYYINYGYLVTKGDSVPLTKLLADMASYAYGGVVGFSKLIGGHVQFDPTQNPLRTPMYIIDAVATVFGITPPFVLGSEHAPFLNVGPALSGNVYTALYAYYGAGGAVGMLAWSLFAGLVSGWVYRSIARGRHWAFFVYPWVAYACVMSVQSEQLFGSSLQIIKTLLLLALLGFLILRPRRRLSVASSMAQPS